MTEQITPFYFCPKGHRVSEEMVPIWCARAYLATLFNKFKDSHWLRGALVQMHTFNDPRVLSRPTMLVARESGSGVIMEEPYNYFMNGPRWVLTDREAYMEWKKRADKSYEVRGALLTGEELQKYAATGDVPKHLAVGAMHPSPPRVILDFSADASVDSCYEGLFPDLQYGHSKFLVEVKAILTNNMPSASVKLMQSYSKRMCSFSRMKVLGDDVGGARPCVEMLLRHGPMLQQNVYSLRKCSYETKKKAYEANRSAILEWKTKQEKRKFSDSKCGWAEKIKLAQEYQEEMDGISLHPKKKSKKTTTKKSKKNSEQSKSTVPVVYRYDVNRQGAAKAKEADLNVPQIAWSNVFQGTELPFKAEVDVLVVSPKTWDSHYVTGLRRIPCEKVIVLGKPKSERVSTSCDYDVRYLVERQDILKLRLLLQWLPLWWDYPKYESGTNEGTTTKLKRQIKDIFEKIPSGPEPDESGEVDPDMRPLWIIQFEEGARHLPAYAKACGYTEKITNTITI